jgi:PAS domain-containing protein
MTRRRRPAYLKYLVSPQRHLTPIPQHSWCAFCKTRSRQHLAPRPLPSKIDPSYLSQFSGVVRESLERIATLLDTIFENADDAIFLMDDLRFVDCNPATLRMFGCSSSETDEVEPGITQAMAQSKP